MLEKATIKDLNQIMTIISDAKKAMKEDGLFQWQDGYPNNEVVVEDINNQELYVLKEKDKVLGICVINGDYYSQYKNTPNANESQVIHRVAVSKDFKNKGIGKKILLSAIEIIQSEGYKYAIIDTNSKNSKMLKLIENAGFKYVSDFKYVDNAPLWKVFALKL